MRDCAAPGCRVQVREDVLACRPHWKALPSVLRRRIVSAWRTRQRIPTATGEHRLALVEAMKHWQKVTT